MQDGRDRVELTIVGDGGGAPAREAVDRSEHRGRPFLMLWFRCAGQYGRAYRSRAGDCYMGRCPKCAQTIRFGIGPDGRSDRQFVVSCD